ncbi:MAG: DUF4349 domain-containing protein [Actinomycetota bacterium]
MTDTKIDFLDQLGDDLRLAAARETVSHSAATPLPVRRRGGSRRWLKVGAAAAAFLTVAGIVGTQVTGGGGEGDAASTSAALTPEREALQSAPAPEDQSAFGSDRSRVGNVSEEGAPVLEGYDAAYDQAETGGGGSGAVEDIPGAAGIPGEFSKVIKTADLSVQIPRDTFGDRFQQASLIAEDLGGFVTTQSAGVRSGSLVMRVPARYFNRARGLLKDLGIRTDRDAIQSADVTAEFLDLKARLEILQARRTALTTLLRKANSLEEILRLTSAVDDVLIRIEELKGRVNLINDQTSKATISVELHEEGVEPQGDDEASILDAWTSSIDGFIRVVGAIVIGVGYMLPLLVLGAIGWFVARSMRRRPAEHG